MAVVHGSPSYSLGAVDVQAVDRWTRNERDVYDVPYDEMRTIELRRMLSWRAGKRHAQQVCAKARKYGVTIRTALTTELEKLDAEQLMDEAMATDPARRRRTRSKGAISGS